MCTILSIYSHVGDVIPEVVDGAVGELPGIEFRGFRGLSRHGRQQILVHLRTVVTIAVMLGTKTGKPKSVFMNARVVVFQDVLLLKFRI